MSGVCVARVSESTGASFVQAVAIIRNKGFPETCPDLHYHKILWITRSADAIGFRRCEEALRLWDEDYDRFKEWKKNLKD